MDHKNSFSASYAAAGVDITAGYRAVELMKKHVARTRNSGCLDDVGGFGGCFGLGAFAGMEEPVLVSGTDGCGTKVKLAMLILGDSGIGKSETAIELVKRGHRLVADDAVELKRVSAKTIVGSAPEVLRHYTELRGIGIVDVRRTFGIGAVKNTEKVDMVLKLEHWDKDKFYDRIGLEMETTDILGLNIPTTRIPVSPGRNLAVIIEIAAMNNKQRRMGYNTAEHFTELLSEFMMKGQGINF